MASRMEPASAIANGLLGFASIKPAPITNGNKSINSNNIPFCSILNYKIHVRKLTARITAMEMTMMKI